MTAGQSEGKTAGIITAAGLSSRMGHFKPLLPFAGSTLIETTVAKLRQAGAIPVIVVVGFRADEIKARFKKRQDMILVNNDNYQNGDMLESVKIGLSKASDCDAAYVVPGDMPVIAADTFRKVRNCMEATGAKVVFPTMEGMRKHPPLIHRACFSAVENYRGEGGLRAALEQFSRETACIPVDDIGCTLDADTWEDYQGLLAYQEQANFRVQKSNRKTSLS